jgi:hypothetical protein
MMIATWLATGRTAGKVHCVMKTDPQKKRR